MKQCVYFDLVANELRIFWTYFGDVVELPRYKIGPYYYIGEF